MKLNLDDIALFVRVAALGSLSAAARERQVAVSQVTRALARLEAGLGTRLMHRTTHGLSLTDEGDTLLARAGTMLEIAAELDAEFSGRRAGPSGWVRVSVSAVLAQAVIAPALPELYRRHPGLRLDVGADDRLVDLARDGIDVAFRTGEPQQETLVARPIGTLTRGLYAAPAYLEAHGTPRTVGDLDRHQLVTNSANPALNLWSWRGPRGEALYDARGRTRVDNTAALVAMVQCGVGIARLVDLVARPLVAAGQLVPVLRGQFVSDPVPMYATMLRERHRLPKVRACIDYWAEWLAAR